MTLQFVAYFSELRWQVLLAAHTSALNLVESAANNFLFSKSLI
jgi:hypothetical protein